MSRRPATLAVAGLLCVGLTGCGTGQSPQTYKKHSYDYVNVDLGALALRNLAVDGPADGTGVIPAGGTARVTGTFVSQSDSADALTGASSPAAATATLEQDGHLVQQVAVPKLGSAGGWSVVLQGTTEPLRAGSYIDLLLTFAKAGRTTLHIPVRSNGYYSGAADQNAQPDASPTASPSTAP